MDALPCLRKAPLRFGLTARLRRAEVGIYVCRWVDGVGSGDCLFVLFHAAGVVMMVVWETRERNRMTSDPILPSL
ncbi:hypothetical protein CC80DRAFT_495047 [Byssothecium circinans]|uniref:Uncharacterized protein n=1 Tax=Byssothecium circinans TaxID=147558 RepID=A0A6A5TQ55_9PLEO|nr:hypothetical protein CC80DRAFT_495047 [Byssothecium circinans]